MKTVTICGSMRFAQEMKHIAFYLESKKGLNVLQCTYNDKQIEITEEMSAHLKKAHYQKIEMSDMIYVLDINRYIGESVEKEIAHAKALNKEIVFYSEDEDAKKWHI